MRKRIVGIFILLLSLTLFIVAAVAADEWDGNRRRKPAERTGVSVEMDTIAGSIMEILQSEDTMFLRVGDRSTSQWVAIMMPKDAAILSQLQVGNSVTLQSGVVMKDYQVTGLNRRFDRVIFSPGVLHLADAPLEPTYRDGYNR